MFLSLLAAAESSSNNSALTLIIPAIVAIAAGWATSYWKNRDNKDVATTDIYKAQLEQITKQREQVSLENDKLRDDLKEELEDCRKLRAGMESSVEELKRKINTIEAELFAWRNGFKTPGGYILVRVSGDEIPYAPTTLSQTENFPHRL